MVKTSEPLGTRHALNLLIMPLLGEVPKISALSSAGISDRHLIQAALLMQSENRAAKHTHRQPVFFDRCKFNLYAMRRKAKVSQLTLAEALNVKQNKVSYWERGLHLPTVEQLPLILHVFGIDRVQAAHMLLEDMKNGLFHFSPAHLAYLYTGDTRHPHFQEIQWAITVYEWRWQFGAPMTIEAGRLMAGASKFVRTPIRGLSSSTLSKIEKGIYPQVTSEVLLALAIAYSVSPLSLLNGLLMTYPRLGTKSYIGGGEILKFRSGQTELEDASYNEEEFYRMKKLCIQLGLVPKGQVHFFEALSLYEISYRTDLEKGEVEYRPFPLTYAGLQDYLGDEQTAPLAESVQLPSNFSECYEPTFNGVLKGIEAYQIFKVEAYLGFDYWRNDMAKFFGLGGGHG